MVRSIDRSNVNGNILKYSHWEFVKTNAGWCFNGAKSALCAQRSFHSCCSLQKSHAGIEGKKKREEKSTYIYILPLFLTSHLFMALWTNLQRLHTHTPFYAKRKKLKRDVEFSRIVTKKSKNTIQGFWRVPKGKTNIQNFSGNGEKTAEF